MVQNRIALDHRAHIESFTRKHEGYSDFNFTSMRSWDIEGRLRHSELYGNLVVRFSDYLTGEPFYSFLGEGSASEASEYLLSFAAKEGLLQRLKLVPACSIVGIDHDRFLVTEDRDQFDYVYDVAELSVGMGSKFSDYRYRIKSFLRAYTEQGPGKIQILHGNLREHAYNILAINEKWRTNKIISREGIHLNDMKNESEAIQRIFADDHALLAVICFFHTDKPIGYIVYETLEHAHAVIHFMKADVTFSGISQFMVQKCSEYLVSKGYRFLNCEQDLGLPGLRNSKMSFRPCHFLKKYTIEWR